MKRFSLWGPLCCLLLAVSACTPSSGGRSAVPDTDNPRGALLHCEIVSNPPHQEGDLAIVQFTIRNSTKGYILLREIHSTDGATTASWIESRGGVLAYQEGEDAYLYNSTITDAKTEPCFNAGLLCPNETVRFRRRMRLLSLPRGFVLRYRALSPDVVPMEIYFGVEDRAGIWVFRRLSGASLTAKLTPSDAQGKRSHRTILHPVSLTGTDREEVAVVDTPLAPRPFTLAEAGSRIGITSGKILWTYASFANSWFIQAPGHPRDRAWLVSADAVHEIAPVVNPALFFLILDAAPGKPLKAVFLQETKTLFAGEVSLRKWNEGGRVVYGTMLSPDERIPFMKKVKAAGLVLDAIQGRSSGTLLVRRPNN